MTLPSCKQRVDFSGVLYFGWPNQPSSGTMRVYIGLHLCTYILYMDVEVILELKM